MLQQLKEEWTESFIKDLTGEQLKLSLLINLLAINNPVEKQVYNKFQDKLSKDRFDGYLVKFSYKDFKKIYSDKLIFYKLVFDIIDKEVITPLENNLYQLSEWAYGNKKSPGPMTDFIKEFINNFFFCNKSKNLSS